MSRPIVPLAAALALSTALPALAQEDSQTGPILYPEIQSFLDSLAGAPAVNPLPPEEARQVLIGAQTNADVEMPAATVEEKTLAVGPDGETKVFVVSPEGESQEALPGVVYFHGGGWILGNFTTHERLMREMANKTNAVYVFVEYAPSPEQKHPYAIEQDYGVLEYVAQNPDEFGIDGERLAIAGDSVGGHMVATVAMMARQNGGPEIDAQVMFYPVTTAELDSESYSEFADGPWLTKAMMEWFWDAYLPEGADTSDPMISPLMAEQDVLADFAPTLVITDENDVLRDEGEAFAEKLAQAGVEVQTVRYNETIHDFVMLNPITDTPATRAAIDQAAQFLSQHLSAEE